jgi:hypothetical protein
LLSVESTAEATFGLRCATIRRNLSAKLKRLANWRDR